VSGFGRFIPDNFAVSLNSPLFGTVCASGLSNYVSSTYVGQPFVYATLPVNAQPVITVTARNGTNNGLTNATTTNYAGAYVKFSNVAGTSLNQGLYSSQSGRYSRFDALGGATTPLLDYSSLPLTTADPVIGTFTAGVGALTFSAGAGLAFIRSTTAPNLPFNADIALAINVLDADNVAFAGNPATFGAATSGNGIAFANATAKQMRFGRMRLGNANGSTLLDLPIPLTIEYNSGGSFAINTDDSCTTISANNISMTFLAATPNLVACETALSPTGTINFNAGKAPLKLTKPGSGNNGAVDLTVVLNAAGVATTCTPASTAVTSANQSWLQGNWGTTTYNTDPAGRATFGTFKGAGEFIYLRENY
jgi:MSHA biogenesis protein MshQ